MIFGVHNLCGVGFLMQKKKPKSLFTPELLKVSFLHDSLCHSSEVFLSLVSRLDFS